MIHEIKIKIETKEGVDKKDLMTDLATQHTIKIIPTNSPTNFISILYFIVLFC